MSTISMPAIFTDGQLGHLTPEQTEKLQTFWVRIYEVFDGDVEIDQTVPTSFKGQEAPSTPVEKVEKAEKRGWLFRKTSSPAPPSPAPSESSKDISKIRFTGADIQKAFWRVTMMTHPDVFVLKFLRARKWNIDDALKMFLEALKWRIVENIEELYELSDVELDAKYPGFINQLKIGKAYIRGTDETERPLSFIRARLHKGADQPAETTHRFTLYTMECGRLLVTPGVEKIVVVFDLTGFGLANMDWGFVRLFVQCFESYYPETLGACVIHNAPFVFWGLWKLIQPLLDPTVTSKFVFTRNNAELHKIIPREHLAVDQYEGLDEWEYSYTPVVEGENADQKDVLKKQEMLIERNALEEKFEGVNREWIKNINGNNNPERDEIAAEMREQYFRMLPYVRAKNVYQRSGVVSSDGEVNWNYKIKA